VLFQTFKELTLDQIRYYHSSHSTLGSCDGRRGCRWLVVSPGFVARRGKAQN